MPLSSRGEYNPIILGFADGEGPISIPLQVARERYGLFPSEYGLLPNVGHRRGRKTLNLSLGMAILAHLRQGHDLRGTLARFYERWERDFQADFGVQLEPFLRRNDAHQIKRVLDDNAAWLAEAGSLDVREYLRTRRLVSPSTLESIADAALPAKAADILTRKARNPAHDRDRVRIAEGLARMEARRLVAALRELTGGDVLSFGTARLAIHADEIVRLLAALPRRQPLRGVDGLDWVRGKDVEFEFAARDGAFFALGREAGDCTADKSIRQVDREVENIYWTVFAWFLDRHYQILKVFLDGHFVMKVHVLPLHVATEGGAAMVLAVDAIETAPVIRDDTPLGRASLLERKAYVFQRVVQEVVRLARAMGIQHACAERFSNTGWVREELARLPEIYLGIGDVRKVDELEDVFEVAKRICSTAGAEAPRSVFMELQMKNAYLQPGVVTVKGVKSFALMAGDTSLGIPMKRAFGV
jgi:hypothetical protein